MSKKVIATDNAPGAIGPYSQGIVMGDFVYTSGQLPINIKTGEMPETIEEQTKYSLENVKAIIEEAGSSMENVIKTTVFLSDMNNFTKMNEVYKSFFSSDFPARSCVEVARLPKDALVEIEVIAELKK
ncbi:MAG: RidA family protein [Vallitalea sp.]|jgi:2-iminobutanoate/2-iminopropanoate deaminase|nr:RidA family protein [Vallitalea sp.]